MPMKTMKPMKGETEVKEEELKESQDKRLTCGNKWSCGVLKSLNSFVHS